MSDPTHASVALNAQARIESAAFLTHFDALVDPRQSGKVIYPLNEVLLLCLLATLAGAETFVHCRCPARCIGSIWVRRASRSKSRTSTEARR